MKIITQWEASMLTGSRPYYEILHNTPAGLETVVPPSLFQLNHILPHRRNYCDHAIDRAKLVRDLTDSHQRRIAPASTMRSIERLNEPSTFLVMTGQQPGLLCGPLYTLYKILQTIALANRLNRERDETFLPAFWDAADDHDFDEIATIRWLSKNKEVISYTWSGTFESHTPFYKIPADACPVEDVLKVMRESMHPTEFMEGIFESIRTSAVSAESYPDFFDRLIWRMFPEDGLLILRPDDRFVREASRPILEREIHQPGRTSQAIEDMGNKLRQRGYLVQLHKRPDRTSFFLIEENRRTPLYINGEHFESDTGRAYTFNELLNRLEKQPEDFSPSAVLRPVVQDALFPTAAVILGPGEAGYHALLQNIYEAHDVVRPCTVPRSGFTAIDAREKKLLDQLQFDPNDLKEHPVSLLKRIEIGQQSEKQSKYRKVAKVTLDILFETMIVEAEIADPTIVDVLKKNRRRIEREIEQSETLLVRRMADRNKIVREQIDALRSSILPNGELQEREMNPFGYVLKYGLDLIENLKHAMTCVDDGAHEYLLIP